MAVALALLSLFVSLGGVGYAAATIGSRQIKNNSIRGTDIRNGTVASRDIKNRGVTGTDVKDDGLTGKDIQESTLGQVPSANAATTATTATTATSAKTADKVNANGVDTTAIQNRSVTATKLGPQFVEIGPAQTLTDDNTGGTANGATVDTSKTCTGLNSTGLGGGVLISGANLSTPAVAAQVHVVNAGSTGSGWSTQIWSNAGVNLTLKPFVYCLR